MPSSAKAILVASMTPALFTAAWRYSKIVRYPAAEKSNLCLSRKPLRNASASLLPSSGATFSPNDMTDSTLVAARADRRRAAGQMGVEGVVAQVGAGIDASLDQQVHVGPQLPVISACAPEALIFVM